MYRSHTPSPSTLRLSTSGLLAVSCALAMAGISFTASAQHTDLDEIMVYGDRSQVRLPEVYAGGQVARGGRVGILGNLDMMDTPFTSTSYTEALIRDQQAKSVGEVLRNDPTVRVAKGLGNFQELYMIRGLPVFSDAMTYNGIYGILPRQYVAAELLERVEVFRGANSFLNGAPPGGSGVGGAVNLVPKRADNEPSMIVTTGFESHGQGYLALDADRRFGVDNSTGVRVNAVRRDGETSIEDQDRELSVLSLGVDYSGERLRLSADLGFQDHYIDAPRPSVTPLGDIPSPPDAVDNFAQPWTYTDERQLFGVVRGEYDLSDYTTVWAAAGMRDGEEDNVLSNPDAFANGDTIASRFDNIREDEVWSADAGIKTELRTGAVAHQLVLSVSAFSSESRNAYAMSSFAGFASNLYNPVAVAPPIADFFVGGALSDPHVTQTQDISSMAIADTMAFFDEQVLLTLGARYQNMESESFDYNNGASFSRYDESQVSPMAGLVIKPSDQVSLYANYIEGLIPGEIAPSTSGSNPVINAGEVFEPYQAEQIEIGSKYDGGAIGGSLSIFSTAIPSAYVESNVFSVAGEQRNRGIELSLFGQPAESLRVIGGITLLDAEMIDTQGGLHNGNEPIGVPDTQVNINLEWLVPGVTGLSLDVRGIYTSSQYANAANTISIDSVTRFDLGMRYQIRFAQQDVTLRARLNNVSNDNHWTSVGGYPGSNYLVLGAPRTLVLSGTVHF